MRFQCSFLRPALHTIQELSSLRLITIISATAFLAIAQTVVLPNRPVARFYPPHATPDRVRQIVAAISDRLDGPGRERLTMSGNLRIGAASSPATVVIELPGQIRIEHNTGRARVLAFDLTSLNGRAPIDDDDEDLVESLGLDTTEQFLYQIDKNAAIRLLGHGFRVASEQGFGSTVDIFQATIPTSARRDGQTRVKQFMFDSSTGLLRRVAYTISKNSQAVRASTLYSGYSAVNGTQVPALIVRQENGREVFRFERTGASVSTLVNDSAFRQP